jgi:hypothetical protein
MSKLIYYFFIVVICASNIANAAVDVTAAYNLLSQRTTAINSAFYVYQDVDSAFNHSFPSGFIGDYERINLNAACMNDGYSPVGCTTDSNAFDREHGTVLRIAFGPLASPPPPVPPPYGYAGVSFIEPQNWFVTGEGHGYDLRGATELVFDARSPTANGIRVKFGMAGQTMAYYIPIPQSASFTTVRIPIAAFNLSPIQLDGVQILFTVVTDYQNAPNGGILLLDNIRFEPVPSQQQLALGLPLSTQTFGVVTPQNPVPSDQANRNIATIYESSLTLLALLGRSSASDLNNAKLIAESMHYALSHDNHGDNLPPFPTGSLGLHNAYQSGDIALFNGQGAGAGQEGDIRVAGFSSSTCSPSNYCVILDGATGGNNAFAILSLISAYQHFHDNRYLDDARQIGLWIINQLLDTNNTGYGGYYLGYPDSGAAPPKPLQKGKSIENNADIFAAFSALAFMENNLGNVGQKNYWTDHANIAGDFVMQMYDSSRGCFFAGTVPNGSSIGPGVKPDGATKGNDTINTYDFIDSNSFTILAMAGSPRYAKSIDWRLPTQCILDRFAQTVTAANHTYLGFNIVTGGNGIAWEFTGQVVEVMNFVDQLYNDTRFANQAVSYLDQITQAQATAPFGDGSGLVASTLQDGVNLPPIAQCLTTPFQCIPERVGLAATTWAIFAAQNFNPLNLVPNNPVPPIKKRSPSWRKWLLTQ